MYILSVQKNGFAHFKNEYIFIPDVIESKFVHKHSYQRVLAKFAN